MPPGDPPKGIGHFLKELALDLAPVTGEIRSGLAAKKDFKEGRYGWGALNALGAIPLLGMAGRGLKFVHGADIVAKAVKEMRVADELAKTAAAAVKTAEPIEKVAGRGLRRGEVVRVAPMEVRTVNPRLAHPAPPSVADFIEKQVSTGVMTPEAAENARRFMSGSKAKDVLYRGDILPPTEPMFPVFNKTADLGYHVGTSGVASTIKEETNPAAMEAITKYLKELKGGERVTHSEFEAFVKTPEGQRMADELGGVTVPREGHRITPVMVNTNRPMILRDMGMWDPEETLQEVVNRGYLDRHGVSYDTWARRSDDVLETRWSDKEDTRSKFWDLLDDLGEGRLTTEGAIPGTRKGAYDAIQYLNVAEDLPFWAQGRNDMTSGWSLMVPQSQQIKALLGNEGTFSRWNPNIFKAVAGTAGAGLLGSAMLRDKEQHGN